MGAFSITIELNRLRNVRKTRRTVLTGRHLRPRERLEPRLGSESKSCLNTTKRAPDFVSRGDVCSLPEQSCKLIAERVNGRPEVCLGCVRAVLAQTKRELG